jgi:hypothetical protein
MKRFTKAAAVVLFAGLGVIGSVLPANATTGASASCGATQEVCRVTVSASQSFVAFNTGFAGQGSRRASYSVNRAVYGSALCSGTMGYSAGSSCNIGSYRGTITFTFYKGQGVSGRVSIAG